MKIFISYAHVDEYRVRELADILQVSGYDVWFDVPGLVVGRAWDQQLLENIRSSDRFLYALTPESVKSKWCQWEFAQAVHAEKPVITVLMQADMDLPGILGRIMYADFSKGPTAQATAKLIRGIKEAQTVPIDDVPLPPIPHQKPERPIETAKSSATLTDQLYNDAYNFYLQRKFQDAKELIVDCLSVDPHHTEAQKLLPLVERRGSEPNNTPSKTSSVQPEDNSPVSIHIPTLTPSSSPPLIEWVHIPAGIIKLEDASRYGGTRGGKFKVPAFMIAKYPITNAQYQAFIDAGDGYRTPQWWNYSKAAQGWRSMNPVPGVTGFMGDDLPRTNVCWYDAIAFCHWLSFQVRYSITLPSEQQWQHAAQDNDNREFTWGGNDFDASRCNSSVGATSSAPTPVTSYPNGSGPYGVMNMTGNVWEWCLTKWAVNNVDLRGSDERTLRGGAWCNNDEDYFRVAYRSGNVPEYSSNYIGFRCARVVES